MSYISVAVTGAFYPLHDGHARLFTAAREFGDELIVIMNNEYWMNLVKTKGQCPISDHERADAIEKFDSVDAVIISQHGTYQRQELYTGYSEYDATVGYELNELRPNILARGSSESFAIPEKELCESIGCAIIYNVGDDK